jgi:hypothetical protein
MHKTIIMKNYTIVKDVIMLMNVQTLGTTKVFKLLTTQKTRIMLIAQKTLHLKVVKNKRF